MGQIKNPSSPTWTAVSVYLQPLQRRRLRRERSEQEFLRDTEHNVPWSYRIEHERLSLKKYLEKTRDAWSDGAGDRKSLRNLEMLRRIQRKSHSHRIPHPVTLDIIKPAVSADEIFGEVLSETFFAVEEMRKAARVHNPMAEYEDAIYTAQRQRLLLLLKDASILSYCMHDDIEYRKQVFAAHAYAAGIVEESATVLQHWWRRVALRKKL